MAYENYFYIGYFTRTRGLKGEIQLFFEFDGYEKLEYSAIFVEINAKLVPFFPRSYQLLSNHVGFFFLEDVDHISVAEELVRKKVYFPEAEKPLGIDAPVGMMQYKGFYVHDTIEGPLGTITGIDEFPQQYVATVPYKNTNIMFPLVDAFIQRVDPKSKVLYVTLPPGLIEVYL